MRCGDNRRGASFAPNFNGIDRDELGVENVMLKGIRAMSTLSTVLKAGALACIAAASATAAAAEDVTVYVYEKGYFPNVSYLDGATSVTFVNKTDSTLGLDYTTGGVMVNDFTNSVTVPASALANKPLKQPYVFGVGYYSGKGYEVRDGAVPAS